MSTFSHMVLQTTLFQLLTGDTALMNMITGVYDKPPQDATFPYLTLGDMAGSDWSTSTTAGMEYTAMFHIWSQEGGRLEAGQLMERLHALLHDTELTPSGHSCVLIRFLSSSIALENDGWTYHGVMRFRILLQAD